MDKYYTKEFAQAFIEKQGGVLAFSRWFGVSIQMTYRYQNNGFNRNAVRTLKLMSAID